MASGTPRFSTFDYSQTDARPPPSAPDSVTSNEQLYLNKGAIFVSQTTTRETALVSFQKTLRAMMDADEEQPLSWDARDLLRTSVAAKVKESILRSLADNEYERATELAEIVRLFLALLDSNGPFGDGRLLQRCDLAEAEQNWTP
jgi:hypothetical protein